MILFLIPHKCSAAGITVAPSPCVSEEWCLRCLTIMVIHALEYWHCNFKGNGSSMLVHNSVTMYVLWNIIVAEAACDKFFYRTVAVFYPASCLLIEEPFLPATDHFPTDRSYHTIPYHTIPYHTIPYHTIPYHTIPYHTIPQHTIPQTHIWDLFQHL